jgi:hypothetical protein
MAEEQKTPQEQPSPELAQPRQPRHIARTTEPKEEETKTYVVKEGQTWGTNPELQAGDTVELTEAEAAGFEDKLEPVDAASGTGTVERRLEGETGRDFTQTGTNPTTFSETDKPAPRVPRR